MMKIVVRMTMMILEKERLARLQGNLCLLRDRVDPSCCSEVTKVCIYVPTLSCMSSRALLGRQSWASAQMCPSLLLPLYANDYLFDKNERSPE